MRKFIKKYHIIELRFIPYTEGSWVLQYRIKPSQLKWWQRFLNPWITPKCRYLGTTFKYQNPLYSWTYITIGSPEEAQYWRDRFRIYRDLYEYAHSYDESFKADLREYEQFEQDHNKIL